jgi:ribosomal protein S5
VARNGTLLLLIVAVWWSTETSPARRHYSSANRIFVYIMFVKPLGGGFGVGKATDPLEAVAKASKKTKRNIFFVDRYQGDGITTDLAGNQNNCKVVLRATDNGLRGNELIREILKRFGITNVAAKAYGKGKRTPSNVVQATFKALMTHESLEDISLKLGKRLMSLDKAKRLQI